MTSVYMDTSTLSDYWSTLNPQSAKVRAGKDLWQAITQNPDWTHLKDWGGRTPCMRGVLINPTVVKYMTPRRGFTLEQALARDNQGRTLAFYLLLSEMKKGSRGFSGTSAMSNFEWLKSSEVPWEDREGRGIMMQMMHHKDEATMILGDVLRFPIMGGIKGIPGTAQQWLAGSALDHENMAQSIENRLQTCPPKRWRDHLPFIAELINEQTEAWNREAVRLVPQRLAVALGALLAPGKAAYPAVAPWIDTWVAISGEKNNTCWLPSFDEVETYLRKEGSTPPTPEISSIIAQVDAMRLEARLKNTGMEPQHSLRKTRI